MIYWQLMTNIPLSRLFHHPVDIAFKQQGYMATILDQCAAADFNAEKWVLVDLWTSLPKSTPPIIEPTSDVVYDCSMSL